MKTRYLVILVFIVGMWPVALLAGGYSHHGSGGHKSGIYFSFGIGHGGHSGVFFNSRHYSGHRQHGYKKHFRYGYKSHYYRPHYRKDRYRSHYRFRHHSRHDGFKHRSYGYRFHHKRGHR